MQRQAREDAETVHKQNLQNIDDRAAQAKLSVTSSLLGSTSQLLMQGNKSQFEMGKKLAISQALVNTYSSAQKAFDSLAGIPIIGPALGTAAAAAAVIGGIARVNTIKGQTYSQAHDGLDRNPNEGTFLLKRNEMVLDSGTSQAVRDAAPALAGGNGGMNIENFNLVMNIQGGRGDIDWDKEVEEGFMPALDRAYRRDKFLEGVVYG